MPDNETITWLHLSDWHQKGPDFDRKVVCDALIKDIRERAAIDPALAKVDFVIFSGDLAFNGLPAEYEAARKYLLDPVLGALSLKPDKIFIVPGNHDLSRETVYEMLPPALQKPLDNDADVQTWLADKRRAHTLEPFEAYSAFVTAYTGQPTPDYASTCVFTCDGKRVALLGLNSAWMSARNKDAQGEVNDYGFLVMGEPQIDAPLNLIADADLRIAVMHHPFDCLAEFDRNRVETRIQANCHFILSGHVHSPQVQAIHSTGSGDFVLIPAGASYDRRTATNPHYTNAYNWVHLNLKTARGIVFLRTWNDSDNVWVKDIGIHKDGKFILKSLPKGFGKSSASHTPSPNTAKARMQAAEVRYRQLLLETCDIVNLAALPERDRNLVTRELKLRQLYVPLRVWVEAEAGQELPEQAMDAAEKRRNVSWRGAIEPNEQSLTKPKRVSIGERLKTARRLVVLGDPGAGKTTLTRWLATAYLLRHLDPAAWQAMPDVQTLPAEDLLPIVVRCRDLDEKCLSGVLDDILKHTLRMAQLSAPELDDLAALLKQRLQEGQALLMLDGLDEIADPGIRACFCQQLETIHLAYKDAPIIATSRIVGYREMGYRLGRGFEHVTLADLTPEEKDDFVRRWCDLTEVPERRAAAAVELMHDIHSADRIERLTGNPMLLTTMALVKRSVGKLPSRRADLYWEAVQVLLKWRSEVDQALDREEAVPQLEYVAYDMCLRGVQRLRCDEILVLLEQVRAEYPNIHPIHQRSAVEFLKLVEARTALLVEAGNERHLGILAPVYEFRHLTFQEYLAARALVDGCFSQRDVKKTLAQQVAPLAGQTAETALYDNLTETGVVESWREALRLCTSICHNTVVDDVLSAILKPLPDEPAATARARATLAVLCLADEPNASEGMAQLVFQAFARQVNESDSSEYQHTGVDEAVREVSGTRWSKAMRRALVVEYCQREPMSRWPVGGCSAKSSAYEAPQVEEAELTKWLDVQVCLLRDAPEEEAIEAALALVGMAKENKPPIVLNVKGSLLKRLGGSAPMVSAAAWVFYQSSELNKGFNLNMEEWSQLIRFVQNPANDPEAVQLIILMIGNERFEVAVEPLVFRLSDAHAEVRHAAATALGKIKDELAVESLLVCLDDANADVRRAAAYALGWIQDKRAVEPLLARLNDADADMRRAAAYTLGQIHDERAVDSLLLCMGDADAKVQQVAVDALGQIGSERAVEPLLARLYDNEEDMRKVVVGALGQIKDERAVVPLLASLDDVEARVRSNAASALGHIKDERAVESLLSCLDDEDAWVWSAAARALGEIMDNRAVEPLIARLDNADAGHRRAIANALGQIKDKRALEPLLTYLDDAIIWVRREVAAALGQIKDERAVEPLLAHIDEADVDMREVVIKSLGQIRDIRAVEPLLAHIDNVDAHWRWAAAQALGQIKDERAVEPLLARLGDANARVRRAAAEALGTIGSERAVEALLVRLDDADATVRREAVGGLAQGLEWNERRLLSQDLDWVFPFLDPSIPIREVFVRKAARELEMSPEAVKEIYATLAVRFRLKLSWLEPS